LDEPFIKIGEYYEENGNYIESAIIPPIKVFDAR
jgi:hypothetical protein